MYKKKYHKEDSYINGLCKHFNLDIIKESLPEDIIAIYHKKQVDDSRTLIIQRSESYYQEKILKNNFIEDILPEEKFPNLYQLNKRMKISGKKYLSNYFKISLRNPKAYELESFSFIMLSNLKKTLSKINRKYINEAYSTYTFGGNIEYCFKNLDVLSLKQIVEISQLIELIKIYNQEHNITDFNIETIHFTDNRLYKYISNYLSKIVLLEIEDKDFINQQIHIYNGIEISKLNVDNDHFINFLNDLLSFLNILSNYDNLYHLSIIKYQKVFYDTNFFEYIFNEETPKADKLSTKKFKNIIDHNFWDNFITRHSDNLHRFMFMLELISSSSNKRIRSLNYISIMEMLVTVEPDLIKNKKVSISNQFCNNITSCLLKSNFISKDEVKKMKKELYHLYNYRSRVIHGNVLRLNKTLNKLLKYEYYQKALDNFYKNSNFSHNKKLETIIYERLNEILINLFNLYIDNPDFIEQYLFN